nr:hypothetical protein [Tanacetum cinerariifolium]
MQTQTSNTLHNAVMEVGIKDCPPMLAPGNYVQWKSRIKRYIDTKPNHELIHYCLMNPSYELGWIDKEILISEGSPITRSERFQETYKNVSQEIRDQLNAEAKAGESINVQDLETNLYWEFRKFTSQDGESLESYYSRFVTLVKKNQELKTVLYHKLYDILKQHQHEVNEIRAERTARIVNPLALVAQQQPVYHPQNYPTHYTQSSSTRSQQAPTRNRGKAIVNSPQPIYDQEPSMVAEDDETSQDKEIDKLMDLISLWFKKIYKPTNNNLRTSSNTSRANQDNSPRINRSAGYENQRIGNVARARETVGSTMELEAHYMYMAQLQEVSPDAADSGQICDDEPLQKVSTDDHYNVFAMESEHPEQSEYVPDTYPIDQDAHNVIIDSLDMSYDREEIDQNDDDNDLTKERKLLASLIQKLKCEIDESKNRNKFLETSNKVLIEKLKGEIEDFKNKNKSLESSNNHFKEANNKLSETNNLLYTDYKKSEAELARRNSKEYASQMKNECAKSSSTRSQQAPTRNRGKAIVNSPQPIYDQEPSMVAEDDETSQDKEIDKLMDLISLWFKKIYEPTNNNLRTSSNTSRANQDNSPRINRSAGYENQRIGNVARARETVGLTMELEAHYMYMAQLQEVSPDAADSGQIFDDEPLQKVSTDDHYNVFAIESKHPEQSEYVSDTYPIDQDAHNVIIDSLDMSYDREEIDQNDDDNDFTKERKFLASLIQKLKCEIDESKNRNKFLETSNKVLIEKLKGKIEAFKNKNKSLESSNNHFKEANNKLSETNNLLYTDYKKSEAELARRNSKEYAS